MTDSSSAQTPTSATDHVSSPRTSSGQVAGSVHSGSAARASSLADVEVRKGNLSPAQTAALRQVIEGVAESVEREKNAKPDTRGHFGLPTRSTGVNTDNPLGFRSSPLPTR